MWRGSGPTSSSCRPCGSCNSGLLPNPTWTAPPNPTWTAPPNPTWSAPPNPTWMLRADWRLSTVSWHPSPRWSPLMTTCRAAGSATTRWSVSWCRLFPPIISSCRGKGDTLEKIRLIDSNTKCRYWKNDLWRDFAAGVYLYEAQNPIPPFPLHTVYSMCKHNI